MLQIAVVGIGGTIKAHGIPLSASWLYRALLHLGSLKAPPRSYACPHAGT